MNGDWDFFSFEPAMIAPAPNPALPRPPTPGFWRLSPLRLAQYPDKSFIGKLSRGFDTSGSRFDATMGCRGPSPAAVQRFATRIVERYAHHEGVEPLRHYVNRWLGTQTFGLSFDGSNPQPK